MANNVGHAQTTPRSSLVSVCSIRSYSPVPILRSFTVVCRDPKSMMPLRDFYKCFIPFSHLKIC